MKSFPLLGLLKNNNPVTSTEIIPLSESPYTGWSRSIELEDGSVCHFIKGATAVINEKRINYECSFSEDGKLNTSILGDLQVGTIWKAEKASLEYIDGEWIVESTKFIPIRKVWQ